MISYPIRIPRKRPSSKNPALARKAQTHNAVAQKCEEYLNRLIENDPDEIQVYTYGFIAADLGLETEQVYDVLSALEAGHNGITVQKHRHNE